MNHAEIGVHKFRSSQGDVITNQYYMGGDCKCQFGANMSGHPLLLFMFHNKEMDSEVGSVVELSGRC